MSNCAVYLHGVLCFCLESSSNCAGGGGNKPACFEKRFIRRNQQEMQIWIKQRTLCTCAGFTCYFSVIVESPDTQKVIFLIQGSKQRTETPICRNPLHSLHLYLVLQVCFFFADFEKGAKIVLELRWVQTRRDLCFQIEWLRIVELLRAQVAS